MKKQLLMSLALFVTFVSFSQNTRQIQTVFTYSQIQITSPLEKQFIWADTFRICDLSFQALDAELNGTDIPHRNDVSPSNNVIIQIPNPDGGFDLYRVYRNTTMHPDLQASFPEIRTYDVVGVQNRLLKGKIDITPHGFHAMIFNYEGGTFFIDPVQQQNNELYMVYFKKHFVTNKTVSCSHDHDVHTISSSIIDNGDIIEQLSYASCQLRTYRLALAARGEYTVFHGGTVALAQAAQVTSMNRVNGIFEKELAITMEIIGNNHLLIYTDPATDPFFGTDSELLVQTRDNTTQVIGNANFDIGHLFSQGSNSGVAYKGVICFATFKAGGVTGNAAPMGDPFDVDYVAHEMGHQYGASHTQNNGCNRNDPTAMEPGSASTILGYAGICPPNVQSNSDAYFHAISLQEMGTHVSGSGGTCAAITNILNQPPSISSTTGGITVPISTPFALTATATDPNGDAIFYRWEQTNNEVSTQPPLANAVGGPNFRSFQGSTNPTRFFPRLQTIANNGPYTWEVLPSVTRTMNFRVTAHDNHVIGGCSDYVNTTVTFDATAGPFVVTYPSASGISWQIGSTQTVTWNVANTTNAAINCQFVNIFLSVDGGLTYPHVLATNVANNGSANVNVPNLPNNTSRVMVRSANGAFFDISNNNFMITSSVCNNYNSTNVPINISASGIPTITSTLNVAQTGVITNVDVINLVGTHTYMSDLTFSLTSPQGTTVVLFGGLCGSQDNFNINLSSSGLPGPIPCDPTGQGGTYQPTGSIASFIGQNMQGIWTLTVSDNADQDGGQLQSWSLNICAAVDPCPTPSVAPTSINTVGLPFCQGGELNLTQVGGSLAPGAQWEWFSGTCGGSPQGTGNSITVSPNANTTFFVRAGAGTGCPETTCTQLAVDVPQIGNSLSLNNDVATCTVNSGDWVHFYNAQGRLLASINSNGQDLGQVTANSIVNNNSYTLGACSDPTNPEYVNAVLARSFIITPQFQPNLPVTIRLYIQQAEFLNYQAAALGTANSNDDVQEIGDLNLTKHSGGTQTGVPADICAGGGTTEYVLQSFSGSTSALFPSISNSFYLEYQISSFSQFFPMNSGSSPLPVNLTTFQAVCQDSEVNITWSTASESNASHYVLETSRDGTLWSVVRTIEAAGNSSTLTNYQIIDFKFVNMAIYYRLTQVDLDGATRVFAPIQVTCEDKQNSIQVFPNPSDGNFNLILTSLENFGKRNIVLSDVAGKSAYQVEIEVNSGSILIPFENLKLAQGMYVLSVQGLEADFEPIRFVISR